MSPSSSPAERRRARTATQGLAGERARTPVEAVRRVLALQSQDVRAARLAIRARGDGLTRHDVDAACADGTLVRAWAMRGTLHVLAREDVPWVVGTWKRLSARVIEVTGRTRRPAAPTSPTWAASSAPRSGCASS